jgi:hypothetical protein
MPFVSFVCCGKRIGGHIGCSQLLHSGTTKPATKQGPFVKPTHRDNKYAGAHAEAAPSLDDLKHGKPGERFQRLYEQRQASSHGPAKNVALILTGVVIIAAGLATYPIPIIPSEFILVCGVALVAQCSKRGARLLDRMEVRFRSRCAGAIKLWKRIPVAAKVLISVAASSAIGALSLLLMRAVTD